MAWVRDVSSLNTPDIPRAALGSFEMFPLSAEALKKLFMFLELLPAVSEHFFAAPKLPEMSSSTLLEWFL